MSKVFGNQVLWIGVLLFCTAAVCGAEQNLKKQTLHFVQDDAQDYMVSKIYYLKFVQSNDILPFVQTIIKRYNMNSQADCIEYGASNQQILTVSCPVKMMSYVDEFIRMVDRDVRIDGKTPGDVIRGTGITRAVYRPKYRSGQVLVDIIVNAVINAGPYGSVYGWDQNSNQIYWKDNTTNSQFVFQFLGFLDRPAPQISMDFQIYEVRESNLHDIGIEYLSWKNGPGLDLFQAGWRVFSLSSAGTAALQSMSGPLGGFFFAPQFDASFLRILQQSGKADIRSSASLTVSNSDSKVYTISFNPRTQNIIKSNNDQTSVQISSAALQETSGGEQIPQISLSVTGPVACLHGTEDIVFTVPDYKPGMDTDAPGTLFFGYDLACINSVERNAHGAELIETSTISGNATVRLNQEVILASWDKEQTVEQVIGIPYLVRIPYLKYLFGTVTKSREKIHFYVTLKAGLMNVHTASMRAGELARIK